MSSGAPSPVAVDSSVLQAVPVEDWDELRDDWRAIVAADPQATVFQSWEWVSLWRKHGLAEGEVHLYALRHPGASAGPPHVRGIAALTLSRRRGKLRKVAPLGAAGADYLDIVAYPEDRHAAARAVLAQLAADRRAWDLADFKSLRLGGVMASLAAGEADAPSGLAGIPAGLAAVLIPHQQYPYIALPPRWETFEKGLSKKLRWQLGYDVRHMERQAGPLSIRRATAETLSADMDALLALHQARWTAKGAPGAFSTPALQAFHRDLAAALLPDGRLWLYTLRLNERPVAALYCFRQGRSVYDYQGGFDAEFARFSPAKTLLARAIRDAIEAGVEEFDFIKGEESYKLRWATQERATWRMLACPKRLRPWLSLQALRLQPVLKERMRRR